MEDASVRLATNMLTLASSVENKTQNDQFSYFIIIGISKALNIRNDLGNN